MLALLCEIAAQSVCREWISVLETQSLRWTKGCRIFLLPCLSCLQGRCLIKLFRLLPDFFLVAMMIQDLVSGPCFSNTLHVPWFYGEMRSGLMSSLETWGYKAQKHLFLLPFCLFCLPYTEPYTPAELLLHFLQGEKAFLGFFMGTLIAFIMCQE